jgi:hypothetical protein
MRTLLKNRSFLGSALILSISFILGSCQKETTYGKLIINVINQVDSQELLLHEMKYVNGAGNKYEVAELKYYLSNFQLTGENCEDFIPENSYHLVALVEDPNFGEPSNDFLWQNTTFEYDIPTGCYDEFGFALGVDPERNADGPYNGDLDFGYSMNWSWKGDYIFFKTEGSFLDDSNRVQDFVFHIGNESYHKPLIPFNLGSTLNIAEGETATINIYANLNEFFRNPNKIDLNEIKVVTAPSNIAKEIADNYSDMFSVEVK